MIDESHPWREELGAYLVGALDADEAEQMRRHIEECGLCREEHAQLAPVVGALARIPAEAFFADPTREVAPDPAMWERLRARAAGLPGAVDGSPVSGAQHGAPSPSASAVRPSPISSPGNGSHRPAGRPRPRRPRRSMRPGTAAAISGALVALAATGIYAGVHESNSSSAVTASVETVSAVNASNGVSGTIQYRPTDWGSWVQITLKGVKPGDDCVLYATDRSGNKAVASTWWAPSLTGESATIPGGVAMQASDIKNFQVTTDVGEVLLTIPAS